MTDKFDFLKRYIGKQNRDLREADVRYQIIDNIFKNILSWPDDKTKCEDHVKSGFIDYTLYNKSSIPVLLIEAKKEGKHFELPQNGNNDKLVRSIKTEELLSNEEIKKAMLQVKDYAEDLGCSYVCITNGHEWIFTNIKPLNKPWKKQPSIVITKLDYFIDDFTSAVNFLGYTAITENFSLQTQFSPQNQTKGEVFYPKNHIPSYNATVSNNNYAGIFNLIARKYLSNIPLDDHDFMKMCYVSDKGHHDSLQKNVQGFIYDSLTPYFKNLGVKEFMDDKKGGAFGYKIQDLIKKQNLDSVMILFGGRGAGKSTFIERLLFYIKPKEVVNHSIIGIINLIDSAQNRDELTTEIWKGVLLKVDTNNLLQGTQEELIGLFRPEFEIFEKQFLVNYSENSEERQKLISKFLSEKLSDTKYCCGRLSLYWKQQAKGLILVLDNLDQLSPDLQDVCFLTAMEISRKLNCLVIISMREERYFNAKSRGTLDAYHTNGFHIASPIITKVLMKRIGYILEKIDSSKDLKGDFDIYNDRQLNTVKYFLIICSKGLRTENSALSQFLRFSTHGDVRRALNFFKSFLTSGYTNINEMTSKGSWTFLKHHVLKPIMIPERFFYDEVTSHIPNIFKVRDEKHGSHFTGLRILSFLQEMSHDNLRGGLVDCSYLVQIFADKFNMKHDCELNLDLLLQRGYIESNNRLDLYSESVDKVRITAAGKYLLDSLYMDFTYIDLVCVDTPVYSEKICNELINYSSQEVDLYYNNLLRERIILRLEKTEKFIAYLKDYEMSELDSLGLINEVKVFSSGIENHFVEEKERVLRSAESNT